MYLEPISDLRWAYQLHYYICFRTRWRRAHFEDKNRISHIAELIAEVSNNHGYHLLRHKVYPDHIRCLLSLRPEHAISAVVNKLKSNTSRQFCARFGLIAPLWATGYLARSVGTVRIQDVKRYLVSQAEHHGYSKRLNPPVFRYRSIEPVSLDAAHAVFDLTHHVVLATRYRRSLFTSRLGKALLEYWLQVARKRGFALDDATVLPDHAHLLVRLRPKMSIQESTLSLMNNGQHWLGKHHPDVLIGESLNSLWQPSAYAGTRGNVTTAQVKAFLGRL